MIVPGVILPLFILSIYFHVFMDAELIERATLWMVGQVDTLNGLSAWQTIKIVLINQAAWFVGIHGSSLISTVGDVVFAPINIGNFNHEIINHLAYLGGSGCTLGLVMTLFFSRRNSNRQFAKYALIPSLFNINELVIFGLPIVLNRFLLLPFLLIPVLAVGITYLSLWLELVVFTNHDVVWSMPFLLGGYLLTGHWSGAILQLFICVMSGLIYWPFLKRYEMYQNQQQAQKIKGLIDELNQSDCDVRLALKSPGELGVFCRRIAKDLSTLDYLEMHYQPKVDHQGKVQGAEALLRWRHPVYGDLSPALFIPIAEASEQIHQLGLWVIERCFKDMCLMDRSHGFNPIPIAINVSPIQLSRTNFLYEVKKLMSKYTMDPTRIEFEITEGQRLLLTDALVDDLRQLADMGGRIAVDDFGMGHTSLHYLRSFPVHSLKIDGEITKDVANSTLVKEIVQSMVQLAHGMNAVLIAEWVEQDAQLESLRQLGCDQYQGKLFSMPLPLPELVAYCVKHQK
jgi:EAL domain-containing protein (putative c-di-GMP-specific phosphodiesterase class I)